MIRELELIELIYKGVDPISWEIFNTPREPGLDKARLNYLQKLRKADRVASGASGGEPLRKGEPWSTKDDASLREIWATEPPGTAGVIASVMGRSEGAIIARLIHIGMFADREAARAENDRRKNGV